MNLCVFCSVPWWGDGSPHSHEEVFSYLWTDCGHLELTKEGELLGWGYCLLHAHAMIAMDCQLQLVRRLLLTLTFSNKFLSFLSLLCWQCWQIKDWKDTWETQRKRKKAMWVIVSLNLSPRSRASCATGWCAWQCGCAPWPRTGRPLDRQILCNHVQPIQKFQWIALSVSFWSTKFCTT